MRVLASLVPLVLLLPAAAADHCVTWSTSEPEITLRDSDGVILYVDNDVCQFHGCVYSIWVYREWNDIPGLQRGDEVVDDTCHGMIDPDGFEW